MRVPKAIAIFCRHPRIIDNFSIRALTSSRAFESCFERASLSLRVEGRIAIAFVLFFAQFVRAFRLHKSSVLVTNNQFVATMSISISSASPFSPFSAQLSSYKCARLSRDRASGFRLDATIKIT